MNPDIAGDAKLRIPGQWVRWALEAGGDPFNIERARRTALELMEQHGVGHWKLRIGGAKDQAGSVTFTRVNGRWDGTPGTLTLSGPLMSLWDEEQRRDTALHEIAHIMSPDSGHDRIWQYHARRIGARPVRLWGEDGQERIEKPWAGSCPGGHQHRPRRRKPRQLYSCTQCHPGEFDARYVITWKKKGS